MITSTANTPKRTPKDSFHGTDSLALGDIGIIREYNIVIGRTRAKVMEISGSSRPIASGKTSVDVDTAIGNGSGSSSAGN